MYVKRYHRWYNLVTFHLDILKMTIYIFELRRNSAKVPGNLKAITGLVVKWYDMVLSKPLSRVRSPSNLNKSRDIFFLK